MTFPTYRLPPEIEKGAQGGPTFSTVIQEAVSGKEQRIQVWAKCRSKYDIAYSVMESDDPDGNYRAVLALFYGHLGKLHPFRFKDWGDYQATNEVFGTGDGVTTAFQLSRTYDPSMILLNTPGARTYTREIYLLSNTPVIKVNGVTKTVAVDYTISSTGLVTFTLPPQVSPASSLTWTGEYDIPVRFDTDYLPVILTETTLTQIGSIPLREVIGAAELA